MKTLNYSCMFCKKEGVIQYDGSLPFRIPAEIACERCATYQTKRRILEGKAKGFVQRLNSDRDNLGPEKLAVQERNAKEGFTKLVAMYAALVCEYKRKPLKLDVFLVDRLMKDPDNYFHTLLDYRKKA